MKSKVLNIYSEIFESLGEYDKNLLQKHIQKHLEIDEFLPAHNSYFIITNTVKQNFPFVGKGFQANLGLDPNKMKTQGAKYWLQHFHPQDVKIFLYAMNDLMIYTLNKVSLEDRKKLTYSWSFRIKTIWDNYKTVFAHTLPVVLDDEGKPIIGVTQHTILGEGEDRPIMGSIKYLNEDGTYKTLLYKNYSKFYINTLLTGREMEISELLAKDLTSKEIASSLGISIHTVNTHRKNILTKTNLKSTYQLRSYFIQ